MAELAVPNGAGFDEAIRGAALATAAAVTDVTPVSIRVPVATYRLQFNANFTFKQARSIVGYLEALGISDCYASSYLRAVPGSVHGYDIADPTTLNPEIGTDEDYWSWIEALRQARMGHILDVVPNHMGIARSANPWWMDVLENGPSSRLRALLRHRVEADQGRAGRQGAAPHPRRLLRIGARGTAARRSSIATARSSCATATTGCRSRRIRIRAFSTRRCRAWTGSEADLDELRSIITAAENLPPRSRERPERDRHPLAREGDRQAASRRPREQERRARRRDRPDAGGLQRHPGTAAIVRSAGCAARRAVIPVVRLARRVRGNQLPAFLRRQSACRRES